MLKDKELIKKIGFPSPLEPDSIKETDEFGLSVGRAIESEWFRRENNECRFYSNRDKFHRLRLYARGEQSTQKYKNELSVNGDLSYMNLDWTPVPIIPKFVDIVVNGMSDRLYSVKCEATDHIASDRRNKYVEEMQKDMIAKDVLLEAQETLGINAFSNDPNNIPENNEELEVHMQLNYKQGIEIAQEEAINSVLSYNEYSEIKKRVDYDLAVLGMGAAKHSFNTVEGIKLEYVDPADMVYSYSDSPYFDDSYYYGEVRNIAISELKKIQPNLTKDDLEKIKNKGTEWNEYHLTRRETNGDFDSHTVNLLYFNYKTSKELVYKQKNTSGGGKKVIKKDSSFNPPQELLRDSKRLSKSIDVWYEGVLVLGTNYLLKWELAKNMVRPKSSMHTTLPSYILISPRTYKGNIESLVQRMIPFADLIQLVHLKLQQVSAKIVPDGIFVDADGLNEVDLGDGMAYNPQKALELYFQTGSVIGRSLTAEGEFNHGKIPIQELTSSGGNNKIAGLISLYNQYMQMIRDVTGLNEARDASSPDSDTLVGVQKIAALNSNTATRHILESGMYITEKLSECISYRVADVLKYSDLKETFITMIGKLNVSILEDIKELHLHEFAIFIELEPDQEEMLALENNIQQALAKDQIFLEDSIDVREVKNIKLANQLLKIRRKRKQKEDMIAQDQMNQSRSQADIASAQAASQAKLQEIQAETQSKVVIENTKVEGEIRKLEREAELKRGLMYYEFSLQMQLEGVQEASNLKKEELKEDRKDERQREAATQQSAITDQKTKGSAPINFESNEDSLDGFDLAEFEPR